MFLRIFSYIWLVLTLFLLLKPGVGYEQVVLFENEDKVAHFTLFFNLSFLWQREFQRILAFNFKTSIIYSAVFTVVLSGLTEVAQDFIPYRGMDIADFGFNIIGVIVGLIFAFFIEKRSPSISN